MSYLTDAVTEIDTPSTRSAWLLVQETDIVDIDVSMDAMEYGERFYKRQHVYSGPVESVVEEVDDGWHVMVMERKAEE